MPSSAPRPFLRRLGWLSVLASGATLFVSGVSGVSSVDATLQAAQVQQRHALHVDHHPGAWECDRYDDAGEHVRSSAAEV